MQFPHCIRAAPFEFCLYAFAAMMIAALVGGLVVNYYVPAMRDFLGIIVGFAYILGMPLAFVGAVFAPVMLLFRRIVWRKRRAFCVYEFTLHLIIALSLAAATWYLFYTMTLAA